MLLNSYTDTIQRATALIDSKDFDAAQSLLDELPERWSCAPEVFALRHRLFTRSMPALLQQPLPVQEAKRLSSLLNARRLDATLTLARSLAARHPHAAIPHEAMALAFNAGRRFSAARDAAQAALIRAPERPSLYRELALSLYELGAYEAMGAPAQRAAEALVDDPLAQRMGAVSALIRGEREMARARFARLAELQPKNGAAHRGFAELHPYTDRQDKHLKRMLRLLKAKGLTPAEELELHFALGKAFDDLDLIDKAFDHFARGNALKKKLHSLDATQDIDDGARVRAAFATVRSLETTPPDPLPILVCGLPRSGTTLTESILAAHPQVAAAGELTFLRSRLLPLLRNATPPTESTLSEVRDAYLAVLRTHAKGRPFVVDKMPLNFVLAGYLAKLIPGTRIVALHREPRALGWSIFRQCFVRTGNGFAYDLRDIADAMALYRQMIGFWEDAGVAIQRLDYGTLTEKPDTTVQALLAGLGLPPDPACVDFANSDRAVVTASALQVREGIQTGADAIWQRYESKLTPLVEQLRKHALI